MKPLLAFLLVFLLYEAHGQSWQCQTISPKKDLLKDVLGITFSQHSVTPRTVQIFVHVIRRTNGDRGGWYKPR